MLLVADALGLEYPEELGSMLREGPRLLLLGRRDQPGGDDGASFVSAPVVEGLAMHDPARAPPRAARFPLLRPGRYAPLAVEGIG